MKERLPDPPGCILDAGCGNGWLALNCSAMGYDVVGLGWQDTDLERAQGRAATLGLTAHFEVQDLRFLQERKDLAGRYDVVTCSETIEHILDDSQVISELAKLLRPSGQLLLTAPNEDYIPMDEGDSGPFMPVEDGRHVRKGYTARSLEALVERAGLEVEEISYCSRRGSQRVTKTLRRLARSLGYPTAWAITLPMRLIRSREPRHF